jgi:tetratricopeptide (TPR) repeat protein
MRFLLLLSRLASVPVAWAEQATLPQLVDALQLDPGDPRLKADLDARVAELRLDRRLPDPPSAPPSAAERRLIVRQAYLRMLPSEEDDAVRRIFLQGDEAFAAEKYLLAADRFRLCRLLAPSRDWLREALRDYLDERIPEAVRLNGSGSYRESYRVLSRADWPAADAALDRYGRDLETAPKAAARQEFQEMSALVKARIEALRSTGDPERRLRELSSLDPRDPQQLPALETLLYGRCRQWQEAWWQRGALGLRQAYFNLQLQDMMAKARVDFERRDVKATTRVLVAVLQKAPGNREALDFMDQMQAPPPPAPAPRAAEPPAAVLAPVKPAAKVPVKERPAPSMKDLVQAEAFYNRGLDAYVRGDLPEAVHEWRRALDFDPRHEKCAKALDRALKEMRVGKAR